MPLTQETVVQYQHKATIFKNSWSADARRAAKIYQGISPVVSSLLKLQTLEVVKEYVRSTLVVYVNNRVFFVFLID